MATLVIESFPEALHLRLKETAEKHRRSVDQETIHLLEAALASTPVETGKPSNQTSYWARRKLLPEYEALLKSGALGGGTDSSVAISEERDGR